MPTRDWELEQTQLVSDSDRRVSPVVAAAFAPGVLIAYVGWLTANLAVVAIGLGVVGQLILSPEWFRRELVDRLDGRFSRSDRVLRQVRKRRLRQHRLVRRLRRVSPIALALVSIAVPAWTALILIRPVYATFAWRVTFAAVVAVLVLTAAVTTAYVAGAWIQLRILRQVRQLYLDPTITAREIADRLESGWRPLIGWALLSVGAICAALTFYSQVSLPTFGR